MKKTVLLVVDVQTALILYGMHDAEKVTDNINSLIKICRTKGIEVIFVRHNSGKGSELEYELLGGKYTVNFNLLKMKKYLKKSITVL